MGEVFRATDERLARDVAIKVLPARLSSDRDAVTRLEREARAIASLSHPNILVVYELQHDGGMAYVVTELLEGENLRERLRGGPLPWRRAVEIGASIADALAAAHTRGIVHRDIKPENVMVTTDGVVKVLDFGLATGGAGAPDVREGAATEVLGESGGRVAGTLEYMSPEQITGQSIDGRSDIFSLGCLLFEMLSGHCPFHRSTVRETLAAIVHEEPPALSPSGMSFPQELIRVTFHCLEKKASERFESARDLAFALRATLTDSSSARIAAVPARKRAGKSIAVLPFANLSKDPNAEYLSDGITDTLINHLAQLPKVRVIARGTAFRYKGSSADARTIGGELKVDMILGGRVLQVGDTLRIQAELVNVTDDAQVWGEHFTRKIADVFAIQDEISSHIGEKLKARLSGETKRRLKKRDPQSAEAYKLYLKGRFYWNKRTAESFQHGIEAFRQAIDLDPNYALAYVGLADCYNLLNTYSVLAPHDAFPKAKAAATRALELDDSLAEAHASLAFVRFYYDWNWSAAESSFRRAIDLNPNYATAHHWYGWCLIMRQRFDEAVESFRRAGDLDPLSVIIHSESVWPWFYARDYDRALGQVKKAMDIDRDFIWIHFAIGSIYIRQRNFHDAISELENVAKRYDSPYVHAVLGQAYAAAGRRDDARAIVEKMLAAKKREYVSAYDLATVLSELKDADGAFQQLELAYRDREPWMVRLDLEPSFDAIREDQRFPSLRARVGLDSR
jgi:eukaryotic-like serine/threonine-protein kinase